MLNEAYEELTGGEQLAMAAHLEPIGEKALRDIRTRLLREQRERKERAMNREIAMEFDSEIIMPDEYPADSEYFASMDVVGKFYLFILIFKNFLEYFFYKFKKPFFF